MYNTPAYKLRQKLPAAKCFYADVVLFTWQNVSAVGWLNGCMAVCLFME